MPKWDDFNRRFDDNSSSWPGLHCSTRGRLTAKAELRGWERQSQAVVYPAVACGEESAFPLPTPSPGNPNTLLDHEPDTTVALCPVSQVSNVVGVNRVFGP